MQFLPYLQPISKAIEHFAQRSGKTKESPCFCKGFPCYEAICSYTPKNSQMMMYAGTMAASVNGIPILKKSPFLTV